MPPRYTLLLLLLPMLITTADARKKGFIYEESEVPAYTLPDPLIANDGSAVTSAAQWTQSRREEVLEHFEQSVYGRRPDKPEALKFTVTSQDENALGGLAKRKQVSILFEGGDRPFAVNLLVYVPNKSKGPAPVFLGYNFNGNHSINVDPGIDISKSWMRKNENGNENHRATEAARGKSASRWPVETILKRGYAVATAYYGDVEPDHADGWKDGIRSFYKTDAQGRALKREDWSAITAWA
ncbi:MAG: acetylxylan esterase, partial [Verrucomicrobiia bacterium]